MFVCQYYTFNKIQQSPNIIQHNVDCCCILYVHALYCVKTFARYCTYMFLFFITIGLNVIKIPDLKEIPKYCK